MLEIFLKLVVMHCLCDYPLQGSFLSLAKRRGAVPNFPWWIALSAHAIIHGGGVWFVTHNPALGVAEAMAHAMIDFAKCEDVISVVEDQAAHVLCKAAWVLSLL